jgi:hypothetical protein
MISQDHVMTLCLWDWGEIVVPTQNANQWRLKANGESTIPCFGEKMRGAVLIEEPQLAEIAI